MVNGFELFGMGYSWGGYESLLIPSFPERTVTAHPYSGRLFRVHAGLEDPRDLGADLERGFAAFRAMGFSAVALDLEGLVSGKLNRELTPG